MAGKTSFRRNKGFQTTLSTGVPFFCFVVGSFYLLSRFLESNVAVRDTRKNYKSKKQFDIEEEHRKMMSNLNLDDFSLSRIPRPDEETTTTTIASSSSGSNRSNTSNSINSSNSDSNSNSNSSVRRSIGLHKGEISKILAKKE